MTMEPHYQPATMCNQITKSPTQGLEFDEALGYFHVAIDNKKETLKIACDGGIKN